MIYNTIIIGAGPAGLSAAMALKETNSVVLEKTDGPGKKILISGSGQCNLTHGGPMSEYKEHYGDKWAFVKHALMSYTNKDYLKNMSRYGVDCVETEHGKVFPSTYLSQDVLSAMLEMIKPLKIYCNQQVLKIEKGEVWLVHTEGKVYKAENVIVATGGKSYPKTGSTGDGYTLAKALKLDMTPMAYALAPIYINDFAWSSLQGLSFKDIDVSLYRQKKLNTFTGDLLITHFGLSGPVIINNSREFSEGDELRINFTEDKSPESLDSRLLKAIEKEPKKHIKTLLQNQFLPQRLVPIILQTLNIEGDTKGAELNKKSRKALVNKMISCSFKIDKVGKSHIAMATAGGISLTNLNKKTFEVKSMPGLFFIGECIDVDGDTGGYNIQFAVSSGQMAGKSIV